MPTDARLRVNFAKGEELRFIAHLDLMRLWERALRRAAVPLAYAHRFNPRPRLAFAAPLPLGFTSQAEVLDTFLERRLSPLELARSLKGQLPSGIELLSVQEVPLHLPSLQSQVRSSEYRVRVQSEKGAGELRVAIGTLLVAPRLPVSRPRPEGGKEYDLRPLILALELVESRGVEHILAMHLETSPRASARPEEVMALLGLGGFSARVHRLRLHL